MEEINLKPEYIMILYSIFTIDFDMIIIFHFQIDFHNNHAFDQSGDKAFAPPLVLLGL